MTTTADETVTVGEAELLACIPDLRNFALSLARNRDRADDLVQDTIVRALTAAHQFRAGTNLKAWLFVILRNHYFGELRSSRMIAQSLDDPMTHEPGVPPNQMVTLEFSDFRRAFWQLDGNWREALILVAAGGLSYEEAAKVCDCPIGTIKSRISRARSELQRLLDDELLTAKRQDVPAVAGNIGDPLDVGLPRRLPVVRKADLQVVKALPVAAE